MRTHNVFWASDKDLEKKLDEFIASQENCGWKKVSDHTVPQRYMTINGEKILNKVIVVLEKKSVT